MRCTRDLTPANNWEHIDLMGRAAVAQSCERGWFASSLCAPCDDGRGGSFSFAGFSETIQSRKAHSNEEN
jgi:hypothetical protein